MPMNPRLLRPIASGIDPAVGAWRSAVLAAGSTVNGAVVQAVDRFVRGCKADGIWDAIKACCVLSGPDTLAGALVPLVGPAPTNNGPFVSGDYNRLTGLVGNGSTKYLNANRQPADGLQNSAHMAIWKADTTSQTNPYWIGASNTGFTVVSGVGQNGMYVNSASAIAGSPNNSASVGLHGVTRSNGSNASFLRPGGSVTSVSLASVSPVAQNAFVFNLSVNGSPGTQWSSSRLAFYSMGDHLDLALLQSRVSSLVTAIGNS
jgi:hypothetical protein